MRKSIVLVTLATVLATLTGACMPYAEAGSTASSPRSYPYLPSIVTGQSGSKQIH